MATEINKDLVIELLLEGIYKKYGYDFRDYSRSLIARRIDQRMAKLEITSIFDFFEKIITDQNFFFIVLGDFTINVTQFFRDPLFFYELKKQIIPLLKTYPFIRIWVAGCSTGEEAYSLAIILKEEELLERIQIYATDINLEVLNQAKKGIFEFSNEIELNKMYIKSGGKFHISDYYTSIYDRFKINEDIRSKIVFANHNLVIDSVFNEMNLILCRNVMIYFNDKLKEKVLDLFDKSLNYGGYLCLGPKESIKFNSITNQFKIIDTKNKIYKKVEI